MIKFGSNCIWLWITIEPENRQILALNISKERNMLVAERFISDVMKNHGKHPVSTDGGTWYPQARRFLKLKHHISYSYEKSLMEGRIHYIRDRIEGLTTIYLVENKTADQNISSNGLRCLHIIITTTSELNFTEGLVKGIKTLISKG